MSRCRHVTAEPMDEHTRRLGVASMLRDGAAVSEVAEILAISEAQVRRDAISAYLDAGEMPVAIAERLAVSRAYVSKVGREAGWSQRAAIEARRAQVERLTHEGLDAAQIADHIHVAVRTVINDRSSRRRKPPRERGT